MKTTDRNFYIPQNSCHHKSWLINLPRGQFLRIKRNCTNAGDYEEQSTELANTFIRKGYDKSVIEKKRYKVGQAHRNQLLENKQIQDSRELLTALIIVYNTNKWKTLLRNIGIYSSMMMF